MDIGMLWFDDDKKRSLTEKVRRAAEFFASRYGRQANLCFVNPTMLAAEPELKQVGQVNVKPQHNILRDHFWLGVGDSEPAEAVVHG